MIKNNHGTSMENNINKNIILKNLNSRSCCEVNIMLKEKK